MQSRANHGNPAKVISIKITKLREYLLSTIADVIIEAPALLAKMLMWRGRRSLQQVRKSSRLCRAPSKPMTERQERLFFCTVFGVGIMLQGATVLKLFLFVE